MKRWISPGPPTPSGTRGDSSRRGRGHLRAGRGIPLDAARVGRAHRCRRDGEVSTLARAPRRTFPTMNRGPRRSRGPNGANMRRSCQSSVSMEPTDSGDDAWTVRNIRLMQDILGESLPDVSRGAGRTGALLLRQKVQRRERRSFLLHSEAVLLKQGAPRLRILRRVVSERR